MSIRSSKGDGRKVTFVLGITEESLKIVSNKEKGLVYESYLHVALTRAKNQIYFGLRKNNDDIHRRFSEAGYVEYFPNIKKAVNFNKISELINSDKLIQLLIDNGVKMIDTEDNVTQTETVDWGYHCVKYQTYYYQAILNIKKNQDINKSQEKSQLFVILSKISRYKLVHYDVKDFYKFLEKYTYKDIPHFPLCYFSDKLEYERYFRIIKKAIQKVQSSIKYNSLDELNVYESIILTFMIQIETSKKFCDISAMDIYNITHFFQRNINKEQELLNNLKNIKDIINKSGINNYTNINWNIFKRLELYSKKDYFILRKFKFPIIGTNENDVIHIVLKSDISQLNYWDTMIEILLERFLIYNPKHDDDIIKFKDRKINTLIFLLDKNDFIKIDWDWDKALNHKIKTELKEVLKFHFESNHSDIYKYFDFLKKEKEDIWNTKPNEIIDDIIQTCDDITNFPNYITDFFNDINTKIEDEEDYGYVNEFNKFNEKLNKKLGNYLNKYLK
tara:strand:- start:72 stop:1580 length:1509 start_codon:yes stop_codon:yes gene_type:complete